MFFIESGPRAFLVASSSANPHVRKILFAFAAFCNPWPWKNQGHWDTYWDYGGANPDFDPGTLQSGIQIVPEPSPRLLLAIIGSVLAGRRAG